MAKSTRFKTGGRDKTSSREAGGFLALPHAVIDSAAFRSLSSHARALLIDVARQYNGHNNGWLVASRSHMAPLGWNSSDMLTKGTRELLQTRLLHMTVMGRRPNRAAWYAVTWLKLDANAAYDLGAAETFVRGAYKLGEALPVKPSREELFRRWDRTSKTQSLDRPTVQEDAS